MIATRLARAAPMRAAIRLLSGERPVNSFPKTAANYRELTPLSYVERAAVVFDDSPAVVDGDATRTWAETFARCCGLGDALRREGCGRGDVVQVMLDNTAEMVEAQHGVPMSGATLGCVNNGSTRRPSPTFHCNGWGFPWTLPAVGGANVCLRDVSADAIADAFVAARVTHLCGARRPSPSAWPSRPRRRQRARGGERAAPLRMMTGGAPPPAATLRRAEAAGLDVTHVYGLTETYGPGDALPAAPSGRP
ncbi:4-coumarate-CoA ligase [Aureococcus anophagefferens]|uniref:4-coumarate-CoA ligase n=1 Tax=Aureococcus anophagefferens TaxID=44056 RepID=A0ABR1G8T1_AURAN